MSGPRAWAERVKDTSTTTGTGDFTLSGTPPDATFQPFGALGTGAFFDYVIVSATEVEVGEGYMSDATTLVRASPTIGSAGPATLVNFSSGTKTVFAAYAAKRAQNAMTQGRAYALARGGSGF